MRVRWYLSRCDIYELLSLTAMGLADKVQQHLHEADVYGHEKSGHVTANRTKRSAKLKTTLRKFLIHKIDRLLQTLSRSQVKKFVSELMKVDTRTVKVKDRLFDETTIKSLPTKSEANPKGEKNAIIRDIPSIGYERFWELISTQKKININDMNFTKEAHGRFLRGVAIFRKKYRNLRIWYQL